MAIGTIMNTVELRMPRSEQRRKPPRAVPRGIATKPNREILLDVLDRWQYRTRPAARRSENSDGLRNHATRRFRRHVAGSAAADRHRPEYLDRDDVNDRVKQQVIRSLDLMGRVLIDHQHIAECALELVSDIPEPKILELGAGHGGLSRKLLEMRPTAQATVTDIDQISLGVQYRLG